MFDCLAQATSVLSDNVSTPVQPLRQPKRRINPLQLEKQFRGRNWSRFESLNHTSPATLARLREAALLLGIQVERLGDGSLLLLDLSLGESLSLAGRFGSELAVSGHFAGSGHHR